MKMISAKSLQLLEIGLIAVAVVGGPFFQVAFDQFVYNDLDNVTTSLYFKTGDTLTITIEHYMLNYTVTGDESNFTFETGIYIGYYISDFTRYTPVTRAIVNEMNETVIITDMDLYYDYHALWNAASVVHGDTSASNVSYTLDITGANRTHANCTVRETGLAFRINLYSIHKLDFASTRIAPGIRITDKNDPANMFMAWFPVSVFSTTKTRLGFEMDARSDAANFIQRIDSNTFRYPREGPLELTGRSTPPQSVTFWTLRPRSSRIVSVSAYHPVYTWNSSFDLFFNDVPFTLTASMLLNLTLSYS